MKASLTTRIRRSNCILLSAALFLTSSPSYGHAYNLRRRNDSSNSSLSYTHVKGDSLANDRMYLKEVGFEVPMDNNDADNFDLHRKQMT